MSERLPWTRYWRLLSDGRPLPCDELGYLREPTPDIATPHVAKALTLSALQKTSCLLLLGEPGTGKSDSITSAYSQFRSESVAPDTWHFVDLSLIGNDRALERKLLDTGQFQNWLSSEAKLSLWLDGLDESIAQFPMIATHLVEELKAGDLSRIELRISCRSAELPSYFLKQLKELWPGSVAELEILPLRVEDSRAAALQAEIDFGKFYEALSKTNTHGFATKPITLFMLLARYQRDGALPNSLSDLYEEGLLKLCTESNERRTLISQGTSTPSRRKLIVAGRIAAMQTFGNYQNIALNRSPMIEPKTLSPRDIVGHSEVDRGQTFEVTDALVAEVLKSGLYKLRDNSVVTWAHQTYVEFLSAWYLSHRGMDESTALSWIRHQEESKHIIPALRGTAAWLAFYYADVFKFVLSVEPEILTRGDISRLSDEQRRLIIDKVLADLESDRVFTESEMIPRLSKLKFDGMIHRLKEVVEGNHRKERTRAFAIRLATKCDLTDLKETFSAIALDTGGSVELRATACRAVEMVGDAETKLDLLPLLSEEIDEGVGEDIKGNVLSALWPDLITPEQLFSVLTPPRSQSQIGSYWLFLHRLAKEIYQRPAFLNRGLQWISDLGKGPRREFSIGPICAQIIGCSTQILADNDLSASFTSLVPVLLSDYESQLLAFLGRVLRDIIKIPDDDRRSLVRDIVTECDIEGNQLAQLLHSEPFLISADDMDWLLSMYDDPCELTNRTRWLRLIRLSLRTSREDHRSLLWPRATQEDSLGQLLQPYFYTILTSSHELAQRQHYKEELERTAERKKREAKITQPLRPPIDVRIQTKLSEAEAGDHSAFWTLHRDLTLVEGNNYYGTYAYLDLTSQSGWKNASGARRDRILDAAIRYIEEYDLSAGGWSLETPNTVHFPGLAGCRALELLRTERHDVFLALDQSTWEKWIGPILAFPSTKLSIGIPADGSPHWQSDELPLVQRAFEKSPQEALEVLRIRMLAEDTAEGTIYASAKVLHIWNSEISNLFLSLIKSEEISLKATRALLGDVLTHGLEEGLAFAIPILQTGLPSSDVEVTRYLGIAACCLRHRPVETWPYLWIALKDDDKALTTLLWDIVPAAYRGDLSLATAISDNHLYELCVKLLQLFPSAEDPKIEGVHSVGVREQLGHWRYQLLNALKTRGTPEARRSVADLVKRFPHEPNLRWLKVAADEVALNKSWEPIHPQDLLKAVLDAERKLARNTDELSLMIVEALRSIEAEQLQGKTPQAFSVWDEQKAEIPPPSTTGNGSKANTKVKKQTRSEFRPKSEEAFSDYLKGQLAHYLRNSDLFINREVEVLRSQKGIPGQRTDILVQMARPTGSMRPDKLSVVIEVKGCWNTGLKTAMKEQLVDRYLSGDDKFSEGIYVVGWFDCPQWAASDYRQKNWKAHKLGTGKEAQTFLDKQAQDLSDDDRQVRAIIINAGLQ